MSHQLNFSQLLKYDSRKTGITIDTVLHSGDLRFECKSKVDTGAEVCLFERAIGDCLAIDIESGTTKRLATLTGGLWAYGHEVILITLGIELQTFVYFAESYDVQRNILGRQGWLQLIKLGVVDYDCELYLSLYDE